MGKSDVRQGYINDMYSLIDKKAVEAFEKGNDIAMFRASTVATWMETNEKNIRRNGFPNHFHVNEDSCDWVRMKGLKVDLKKYIQDRDLISKIDKRKSEFDQEEDN